MPPVSPSSRLKAYLELMRPANVVTAFADVLAGFAIAGGSIVFHNGTVSISHPTLGWLLLSTFGLYGGGVVLNDCFDADLDAKERPERPIPSERVSRLQASLLGASLLSIGVIAAFAATSASGVVALAIVAMVVLYDAVAKRSGFWGPLIMGTCRGGNLLLGISISPPLLCALGYLGLLPVAYIAAITLVSQGEVHGGNSRTGWAGVGLITAVIASLAALRFLPSFQLLLASPFILMLAGAVLPPFIKAALGPDAHTIRTAVKRGVLSLILLNSALAAGFSGLLLGILVLLLLPLSLLLARSFSVT